MLNLHAMAQVIGTSIVRYGIRSVEARRTPVLNQDFTREDIRGAALV